ncbi:MAG TPA: PIN domain-containing protein [Candidatus Paceibacterota bacterium]
MRFSKLPPQEEADIYALLPAFSIIPLDLQIAENAGSIGRTYNIDLADAVIAATALFTGSSLVTRNVRDFKRVPSLVVEAI